MNKTLVSLLVFFALCCGVDRPDLAAAAPQVSEIISEVEKEIATIENGLGPAFQKKGDSQGSWSIEDRMKHYRVPGVSVAVVKDGEIRWAKGYGIANTRTKAPVETETLFQAGSISKPIAALAALKLVDQGTVDLDTDVNQYLKNWTVPENGFTDTEKVTLRRLLTHTAGMTVHGFPGYSQWDEFPTTQQVLDGEGNTDPVRVDTTPGGTWRYSGGGYTVMQKLVEDVSGMSFDEYLGEHVLAPMGMENSTYQQPLSEELHAMASAAYDHQGKILAGNWNNYPEQAAAGLWTTPSELARYCMEIQQIVAGKEEGVLSRDTVLEMLKKHQGDWGLGPSLEGGAEALIFQHGGKNAGFTNEMFAYAHRGDAVIVMTSGDSGGALIGEIKRAISNCYDWKGKTEWIELVELSEESLQKMAGKYKAEMDGQVLIIEIKAIDNALEVMVPMEVSAKRIVPLGDLDFVDNSDGTKVKFSQREDGSIDGLTINGQIQLKKIDDE